MVIATPDGRDGVTARETEDSTIFTAGGSQATVDRSGGGSLLGSPDDDDAEDGTDSTTALLAALAALTVMAVMLR